MKPWLITFVPHGDGHHIDIRFRSGAAGSRVLLGTLTTTIGEANELREALAAGGLDADMRDA